MLCEDKAFKMRKLYSMYRKYTSLNTAAKASLWFTVCYVIQRGIQFISMPIFTRLMSAEEYGVYSIFMSWFNLLCVFSSLSIYNGTFNKAMVKYEDERDRYISSIQFLTLIIGTFFVVIVLSCNKQIYLYTGYNIRYLLLLSLHLLLFPTLQYWSQKQRFLFEYQKLVCVTLANSILSVVLGVLFVILSDEKSLALVAVTVVIQAAINIFLFSSLVKKGRCFYNKNYWKWTILTAVPLLPHYLSEILLGHADRIMINSICGASKAGIYNLVYQISMVMTILRTGINGAFTPWLYYSLKQRKYNEIKRVTKMITLLMVTMTVLIMLVGPEILMIAAPSAYYEAVVDIPAIMIGCFFIFVYVLFLNVEIYYEQNQFVAVASIVAALANVVLNYICINVWGYLAAGYTTMLSYLLMAIMHYCFINRIAKSNEEINNLFGTKFLLVISVGLIAVGAVALVLYQLTLLRWILIGIIFMIIFLKRKSIIQIVQDMKARNT